jgi:hypothetical protein
VTTTEIEIFLELLTLTLIEEKAAGHLPALRLKASNCIISIVHNCILYFIDLAAFINYALDYTTKPVFP